ncbi:hypothetical protein ACIPYS_20875 [Kitasatospora sp. NPDC089913]|uniref:hypothetical protein n=1 Tax=Kitasatospora sp. NPDC089913 TaxID=3364080 RepID=UPI00382EF33C
MSKPINRRFWSGIGGALFAAILIASGLGYLDSGAEKSPWIFLLGSGLVLGGLAVLPSSVRKIRRH